jgi:hypothetical protein
MEVLSKILEEEKNYHPCMVFYGFSGSISIKMIINEIYKLLKKLLKTNEEFKNDVKSTIKDQIMIIEKILDAEQDYTSFKKIFILIHNIDGKNLLEKNGILYLSRIAALKKVFSLKNIINKKKARNFKYYYLGCFSCFVR